MSTVISAQSLGKRYILSHEPQEHYTTLRDVMANGAKRLANKLRHSVASRSDPAHEEFWALRDVCFDIKQGDSVGIIGRNGAGKSTLLKILSRITEPTVGKIKIKGRVASLLEVGTGFHPELTGRENIFLNGAILGMSKVEIRRKFDEIVAFAEVEKFLDTPVKRYSSGMYVRLAFAVAAHLEPEILVVDEVLAVGDAQFQKKCLGKMQDVSTQGRTVLFVSHSMAAIKNLCTKTIYLDGGKIISIGNAESGIAEYLKFSAATALISLSDRKDRSGNGLIRFQSIELRNYGTKEPLNSISSGDSCLMVIRFENRSENSTLKNMTLSVGIDDYYGNRISHLSSVTTNQQLELNSEKEQAIEIAIPDMPLCKGTYGITLYSTVGGDVADWVKNAGYIEVEEGDYFNTGRTPTHGQGVFYMKHSFSVAGRNEFLIGLKQ